jgi:hypothetical protein
MCPEAQIRRDIRYCDACEIEDLSPPNLLTDQAAGGHGVGSHRNIPLSCLARWIGGHGTEP